MSYQVLWFRNTASQLRLLEADLDFEAVKAIVGERLPKLVQEMKLKGVDANDPTAWWEAIFIDGVLCLENSQGKVLRVAVCVIDNWKSAVKALNVISSRKFQAIRTDMGIDRHWVVFTNSKHPHSAEAWIDLLYENIDAAPSPSGCELLEMMPS